MYDSKIQNSLHVCKVSCNYNSSKTDKIRQKGTLTDKNGQIRTLHPTPCIIFALVIQFYFIFPMWKWNAPCCDNTVHFLWKYDCLFAVFG